MPRRPVFYSVACGRPSPPSYILPLKFLSQCSSLLYYYFSRHSVSAPMLSRTARPTFLRTLRSSLNKARQAPISVEQRLTGRRNARMYTVRLQDSFLDSGLILVCSELGSRLVYLRSSRSRTRLIDRKHRGESCHPPWPSRYLCSVLVQRIAVAWCIQVSIHLHPVFVVLTGSVDRTARAHV